jgi:hypothetical protein
MTTIVRAHTGSTLLGMTPAMARLDELNLNETVAEAATLRRKAEGTRRRAEILRENARIVRETVHAETENMRLLRSWQRTPPTRS